MSQAHDRADALTVLAGGQETEFVGAGDRPALAGAGVGAIGYDINGALETLDDAYVGDDRSLGDAGPGRS